METGYTVYSLLKDQAGKTPGSTFLYFDDRQISYREALLRVNRFAGFMARKGIGRGDRVYICLPNIPEFIYAYLAIAQVGAIAVLINPAVRHHEMKSYLVQTDPRLVVTDSVFLAGLGKGAGSFFGEDDIVFVDRGPGEPRSMRAILEEGEPLESYARLDGEGVSVIIFTSAMDGEPLGAQLTHRSLCETSKAFFNEAIVRGQGYFLASLPLFHSFGLATAVCIPLANGMPVYLLRKYSPKKIVHILKTVPVSVFCGVPLMFEALRAVLPAGEQIPDIPLVISGGEAIDVRLIRALEAHNIRINEGYGLTEASPIVTWNDPAKTGKPAIPGSVGIPMPYNEVGIWHDGAFLPPGREGEVIVRGINVTTGYYGRPDKTAGVLIDGWLHTGDTGRMDEEGYLYITGMKKNMMIRHGLNIYPREVEKILKNHPAAESVRVDVVRGETRKEKLRATITVRRGESLSAESFRLWCLENIAAYKIPDEWVFSEE